MRIGRGKREFKRVTYRVGLTRFSLLYLVDRQIHTKLKITTVKSSEDISTRLNCKV